MTRTARMKIFFIINTGGRKPPPARLVADLRDILRSSGREHRITGSTSVEHAQELAAEAVRDGFDTLWIGGGDGTINVLLNHIVGHDMALGVVPVGTVNALARSLGLPLDPRAAARFLLRATPQPIDLGRINDRHFICFASFGWDAAVAHDATGPLKRHIGRAAFVLAGLRAMAGLRNVNEFSIEWLGGGEPVAAHSLIMSNIRNYAGFHLFHEVTPRSGSMEALLFRRRGLLPIVLWAFRGFSRSPRLPEGVE